MESSSQSPQEKATRKTRGELLFEKYGAFVLWSVFIIGTILLSLDAAFPQERVRMGERTVVVLDAQGHPVPGVSVPQVGLYFTARTPASPSQPLVTDSAGKVVFPIRNYKVARAVWFMNHITNKSRTNARFARVWSGSILVTDDWIYKTTGDRFCSADACAKDKLFSPMRMDKQKLKPKPSDDDDDDDK